jgi:hypothetical protein
MSLKLILVLIRYFCMFAERSPTKTCVSEESRLVEADWPQGLGELAPEGFQQHFRLGRRLRQRYVDQLRLLETDYNNREVA